MAPSFRRLGAIVGRLRQVGEAIKGQEQEGAGRYARLALLGASGAAALAITPSPAQCYYDAGPDGSVDRLKRWTGRTWGIKYGSSPGFHLRTVNPWLERHLTRLTEGMEMPEKANGFSVLVPLCGKSMDLPYLCEQGFAVVGVEGALRPLIELRVEHRHRLKDFKKRNVLTYGPDGWVEEVGFIPATEFQGAKKGYVFKTDKQGLGYYADSPAVWRGKVRASGHRTMPLHIIQGDMFDVTPELVKAATYEQRGSFDIIYDRGGLDNVPPEAREEYVANLFRFLRPGGRLFFITVDYDQAKVPIDPSGRRWSPPPYSMPEDEVRRLFPAGSWDMEVLGRQAEKDLPAGNPSFHGVAVSEVAYLLTKRQSSSLFSSGSGSDSQRSSRIPLAAAVLGVGGVVAALALRRGD